MPRLKQRVPKLHRHVSGGAFVIIDGRRIHLGRYGEPLAQERYDRLMAEWLGNGRELPEPPEDDPLEVTIAEVCVKYWQHCKERYTPSEASTIRAAIRIPRRLYGSTPR
jgi:hypothetical protein